MYKLHDIVRVLKHSQPGLKERSYKPKFTEEIFRISKIDTRLPYPRYHLTDMIGEPVIGSFHAHELSVTRQNTRS